MSIAKTFCILNRLFIIYLNIKYIILFTTIPILNLNCTLILLSLYNAPYNYFIFFNKLKKALLLINSKLTLQKLIMSYFNMLNLYFKVFTLLFIFVEKNFFLFIILFKIWIFLINPSNLLLKQSAAVENLSYALI